MASTAARSWSSGMAMYRCVVSTEAWPRSLETSSRSPCGGVGRGRVPVAQAVGRPSVAEQVAQMSADVG